MVSCIVKVSQLPLTKEPRREEADTAKLRSKIIRGLNPSRHRDKLLFSIRTRSVHDRSMLL